MLLLLAGATENLGREISRHHSSSATIHTMSYAPVPAWIVRILRSIAGLILLYLYLPSAMAWGLLGHQLVCDIAWRNLSGSARAKLHRLLEPSGFRSFATACHWPDRIRGEQEWAWTAPYHYINVPIEATHVTLGDCPEEGCVLAGIEVNLAAARASAAVPVQRLSALLFLSHYVADVHQPLHVSYAYDAGGNETELIFEGEQMNLHQLWDSGLLTRDGKTDWKRLGNRLAKEAARLDLPDTTPLDWAEESLALTRRIYAELPADGRLPEDYYERYHPLARDRILLAGRRLGRLLNTLLSD